MTFDDTVARRRAVTYPDAFSTAPGAGPPPLSALTATVLTSIASTRVDHTHPATATATRTTATGIHTPRLLVPARAL